MFFSIRILLFFSLVLLGQSILAQRSVQLQEESFTDPKVLVATLDTNYLYPWKKRVSATIKAFLSLEKGQHDVMLLITMPKGKPAQIEISSRPMLQKDRTDHLKRRISALSRPPRSKLTEYAFLIEAKVGQGCQDPQLKFLPKIALPEEKVSAQFDAANLSAKIQLFQNWVNKDVIPVLAYYQDSLRCPYPAVRAVGRLLKDKSYEHISTNDLTIYNDNYWAASSQIEAGDGLIILSKICMHIAKSEFDLAKRYLDIAQAFSAQNSMAIRFYQQLNFRMEWLYDDIKEAVRVGKSLQIEGDFEGALLHYKQLLQVLPNSAVFNFEYYYVQSLKISNEAPEAIIQLWKDCKEKVYACDPLYNMNAPARNSTDMYLMGKRHEINLRFKSQGSIQQNILAYADIALDLKVFGFAAHLYWLILQNKPDAFKDRDILAHYLYCLEKLGDLDFMERYQQSYSRVKSRKIEKERKKAMESSALYNRSKGRAASSKSKR